MAESHHRSVGPSSPAAVGDDDSEYVGQTLDDRYHLVRLLGRGGMGSVYLARHAIIGKLLAVKILEASRVTMGRGHQRLFREAQMAAAIGHPHIIEVVDVGMSPAGDPYLVMEYLEGEDLGSLLSRHGPLTVAAACAVLEPVLQALQAAHARQVVHRDVKPSNICLHRVEGSPPGVKLIDFGIAKYVGAHQDGRITATGSVLGTPSYMSPEQAMGIEEVDARVDLYSVGVVFYELVTGTLPFSGRNYNEILQQIIAGALPPFKCRGQDLPPGVCEVIAQATRKNPSERFQSAAEFLSGLSSLEEWPDRARALLELSREIRPSVVGAREWDLATQVRSGPIPRVTPRRIIDSQTDQTLISGRSGAAGAGGPPGSLRRKVSQWIRGQSILVGGVFAVAVVGALLWGRVSTRAPLPSQEETLPSPGGSVVITLSDLPKRAEVYYDGQRISTNPFLVPPSETTKPLRVELEGHEPFEIRVLPQRSTLVRPLLIPTSQQGVSRQDTDGPLGAPRAVGASRRAAQGGPAAAKPRPGPAVVGSATLPQRPSGRPSGRGATVRVGGRDTYYSELFE